MSNKISLNKIVIDGDTQLRAEPSDAEYAKELAEAYRRDDKIEPVDLFFDGERYFCGDGHNRIAAAKLADLTEIDANVQQGDKKAAVLFAAQANTTHGKRRTNNDKWKIVQTVLAFPEWAAKSDRDIAEHCKVTHPFVGRVRKSMKPDELETVSSSPEPRRIGKDGKSRPASQPTTTGSKARKKPSKSRTFVFDWEPIDTAWKPIMRLPSTLRDAFSIYREWPVIEKKQLAPLALLLDEMRNLYRDLKKSLPSRRPRR